ncbi:hypothetical protein JCM12856_26950 [Spirochaeta dissipatitropha]
MVSLSLPKKVCNIFTKDLKRIEAEFEALERGEKTARQEVTVPVEEFAEFAL